MTKGIIESFVRVLGVGKDRKKFRPLIFKIFSGLSSDGLFARSADPKILKDPSHGADVFFSFMGQQIFLFR